VKPLHVLIVEDSASDAGLMVRHLEHAGYNVRSARVEDSESLVTALDQQPWDVILCDYSIPGFSGAEALRMVRDRSCPVPFIFVSGSMGEDVAVEAMRAGARDYVMKGNLKRLVPAIERELREGLIRQQKHEAEHMLALRTSALEAAANAVAIVRRDGIIMWVNPAFTKLTGFKDTEAVGHNPRILKSGIQDTAFYKNLWDTVLTGKVWQGASINRRKDGSLYPEEQTITPVLNSNGEVTHFVDVKQDITERRKMEEQFRQVQKMEAIGQLAGGVAHDFNNLLNVMLMQTEMANLSKDLPDDARVRLQEIRTTVEIASNLTRQLLLFSRHQVMQPQDLDLNEVVTNLTKMLRRIIGEHVQLLLNLHPGQLVTFADPGMLDQVLMNLTVNARDAMPQGGCIMIETSHRDVTEVEASRNPAATPGSHVCLSVTDTGTGIPPEILPRIFEPFFTTKPEGKGTGLGLATIFGVVRQHRGWVEVDSKVGDGTRFSVYLPSSDGNICFEAETPKSSPRRGTETVLLTEDEPGLRAVIRAFLEHNGYRVVEAVNGHEALQVWTEHRDEIALLLTDLVMPAGVSGQQLARRLRMDNPNLRAIFMSGYSPDMAGGDLEFRPGENFLQKPFSQEELLETVRQCLDSHPAPL
jgi:PAS domain S-box-containing protein